MLAGLDEVEPRKFRRGKDAGMRPKKSGILWQEQAIPERDFIGTERSFLVHFAKISFGSPRSAEGVCPIVGETRNIDQVRADREDLISCQRLPYAYSLDPLPKVISE